MRFALSTRYLTFYQVRHPGNTALCLGIFSLQLNGESLSKSAFFARFHSWEILNIPFAA